MRRVSSWVGLGWACALGACNDNDTEIPDASADLRIMVTR